MGRSKQCFDEDDDSLERAPWEDGSVVVDVTSVPPEVVLKNCLSDDLTLRLTYIKGLASAATRASRRELPKLLEAVSTLLDDEAVGVRLETLQQLQQMAKLADGTADPDQVREAVEDALEQQMRPSLDPGGGCGGGGGRGGAAGTGGLPMVREELLATLDAVCTALGPGRATPLLMRLHRAANAAQDKPGGVGAAAAAAAGGGGGGGAGTAGGSKASGDAALMALSLAAVAVRHLTAERGGLAAAALAGRLGRHSDLRVREAVAGALPRLYCRYTSSPGALEDLFAAYEPLCNDAVWSVKQAAARVVGELAELCGTADDTGGGAAAAVDATAEHRRQRADAFQSRLMLALLLGCLLPSKSQWVLTAARQQLGPAIAALRPGLAGSCLPPLLEAFCGATAAVGQGAVEVRRAAAASFADVAAKAGPEHWPLLQPVFARLLGSTDGPTLCSLVAGAERIVRVLAGGGGSPTHAARPPASESSASASTSPGQPANPHPNRGAPGASDSAEHDGGAEAGCGGAGSAGGGGGPAAASTAPAADAAHAVVSGPLLEVLRSRLHLVAPAASGSLAGLLGVCPPELQRELLQALPALCTPPPLSPSPSGDAGRCGDWRPRLRLATSLHAAMRAVAPAAGPDAAAAVARCAVTLCADPVWAVRQAAAAQVGLMLDDALRVTSTGGTTGGDDSGGGGRGCFVICQADAPAESGEGSGDGLGGGAASSRSGAAAGRGSACGGNGPLVVSAAADTRSGERQMDGGGSVEGRAAVQPGCCPTTGVSSGIGALQSGDGQSQLETTQSGTGAEDEAEAAASAVSTLSLAPSQQHEIGSEKARAAEASTASGPCCLTEAQRSWLARAVQLAEESGGGGGEAGESGGLAGGACGGDGGGVAILASWLRGVSSQGTKADTAMLLACCRGALMQCWSSP